MEGKPMEQRVQRLEDIVENHEERLKASEKIGIETQTSLAKVENTILTTSREHTDLLRQVLGHHFKDKDSARATSSEIWKVALGAGGIASAVVTAVFTLF